MSTSLDVLRTQVSVTTDYDVIVVGAGPYGLSTAAHLLARGLKVAVFGVPLQLWKQYMPEGMLLRSHWWASNFSDPHHRYTLKQYFQEAGQQALDPLPAATLIDYGLWFQKHAVPQIDTTYVQTIEHQRQMFKITLTDARVMWSRAVLMVPGLHYYVYRPAEYDHLVSERISHTSEHCRLNHFAGKRLVIIGGGQSALETAALAHECGARVQVVSRRPLVWTNEKYISFPEYRPLIDRLRNPKAGIAPDWFSWQLEHFPYVFQRLPRRVKDRLFVGVGSYGPMGAAWLKPRLFGKVELYEGLHVQRIIEEDRGMVLALSNNTVLEADHVMLATGYRVDIRKLPMLHPTLLAEVKSYRNAPLLNNHFESSVAGLYFAGFSSVPSCGPLYRFVVGTEAAALRITHAMEQHVRLARRR